MKAVRGLLPDGGDGGEVEELSAGAAGEEERPPSLSYPEVSSSVPLLKPASISETGEEEQIHSQREELFKTQF